MPWDYNVILLYCCFASIISRSEGLRNTEKPDMSAVSHVNEAKTKSPSYLCASPLPRISPPCCLPFIKPNNPKSLQTTFLTDRAAANLSGTQPVFNNTLTNWLTDCAQYSDSCFWRKSNSALLFQIRRTSSLLYAASRPVPPARASTGLKTEDRPYPTLGTSCRHWEDGCVITVSFNPQIARSKTTGNPIRRICACLCPYKFSFIFSVKPNRKGKLSLRTIVWHIITHYWARNDF